MLLAQKRITDFINSQQLFDPEDSILLAVSGGKDSVLMATLLAACGYKIALAHCNFNLRDEESLRDENFVRDFAQRLGLALYFKSFNTTQQAADSKQSIQMAARTLRYEFFDAIIRTEGFSKVAIAQHQNDAAETILINLIRGTGIAGLHGIKASRDNIIRPMLCFNAQEIEQIVNENVIAYVEDSSNASNKYMRNKIRLDIIPEMEKLNPSLIQTFQQNLNRFTELEELLEERTNKLKSRIVDVRDGTIWIKINDLKNLKPQQLLAFELLKGYGFSATQVADLLTCLNGQSGRQFLSSPYRLTVDRDFIVISSSAIDEQKEITIDKNDTVVIWNHYRLKVSHQSQSLIFNQATNQFSVDCGQLVFPLKLRYWQQGDSFRPLGMKGFKKLSDFFINQKIPRHLKTGIPILVNGNGEIIWICGHRGDDRYKLNSNTKKIITFELQN